MDVVDPVLLQLQRWALQRGLTREAVAQRLGVSRAAVAGWFIGLEAQQAGRGAPRSARSFRYGAQRPQVQHAIAEVLDSSRESLQAESLAVVEAGSETGTTAGGGELDQAARSVIGDLGMGGTGRAPLLDIGLLGDTATSIAHVVDQHPDVRAVAVVKERRGTIDPFHHQVAVLVGERFRHDDLARRQLRDELTATLQVAGLPSKWEHGSLVPEVRLVDSERNDVHVLGSVIAPSILAPRAPRSGLLIPPAGRADPYGQQLRVAAVIGDAYTGNDVVAAVVAEALGAGFVSTDQLRRAVQTRRVRSLGGPEQNRAERLGAVTEADASFVLHKGLHALVSGRTPGSWVVPVPVRQFLWYEPLWSELVNLDGLVVAMRLGPVWRRMAAWRLAAIDLNSARLAAEEQVATSSDQLALRDGMPISGDARRVLDEHHERSLQWIGELQARDERLGAFIDERTRQGADTLSMTLDILPKDMDYLDVTGDVVRRRSRSQHVPERCVFADQMNGATDVWVGLAADVLEWLRQRTAVDAGQFAAALHDGSALSAYRAAMRISP